MSRIIKSTLALACVLGLAGAAFAAPTTMKSFDELDKDKDGVLSKQEAAEEKKLDFAKADLNRDGWLQRGEYEAAIG